MATFAQDDFERLLALLADDPGQQARLRAALGEDRLERALERLATAQAGTDERLARLTERVDRLTERVDQLAARMGELATALRQLTSQFADLSGRVDRLHGDSLERRYREKGVAYFAPIARRLQIMGLEELDAQLERAVADGVISEDEAMTVRWADVVARGRRRDDGDECYLVVEASVGVGLEDVTRAQDRADVLRRVTGLPVLPVVAGEYVRYEAKGAIAGTRVWQVTDGAVVPPVA